MKIKKINLILISCFLAFVCTIAYTLSPLINTKQIAYANMAQRTIEIKKQEIDLQSIFDEYENPIFDTNGTISTFEGVKTFDLSDFDELDLVAYNECGETPKLQVKYHYTYDSEAKVVILTASLIGDDGEPLVDTMIGSPFIDENGNFDAVFDCEGEYILLSELQNADLIENCGWFKNLCKKVTNTVKKVAQTVAKVAYDYADVLVPLAIGVVGGLTGGAAIPVLIAGAAAGALIDGTKTAVKSYQDTGKVDWAATGISAGVGAAVGLVATYTGYSIGSMLNPDNNNSMSENTSYDSYESFKKDNGTANSSAIKYGNAGTSGNYEWHHIVEQTQKGHNGITAQQIYSTKNTISLGYDTHRLVSSVYSTNIENLSKYNVSGLENLFSSVQKGQTVRSYVSTLSFDQQYEIGIKILRLLGVKI